MQQNQPFSISVLSGKGGVGKSGLALNLGYALSAQGHPTLLVDCDAGLANLDVLLGLSPRYTLQDLLESDMSLEDVLCPIEPDGFDLLPAPSGIEEVTALDEDAQEILFDKLERHFRRYHYMILDLPAGISETVLSLARKTLVRAVVVTPEPTSLTDGYALIKVLSGRYGIADFDLIVNNASSPDESRATHEKLRSVCRRFLGLGVDCIGEISASPVVQEAVRRQVPFLLHSPDSTPSRQVTALAREFEQRRGLWRDSGGSQAFGLAV